MTKKGLVPFFACEMKNLLRFIIRNSVILLFILLEGLSFVLIIRNSCYPRSATFSSVNRISSACYTICNNIANYFRLRTENESLISENAQLREELVYAQEMLANACDTLKDYPDFSVIPARIINYTGKLQKNYITINKGAEDGVNEDMGVICREGVVGIIVTVSDHYSLAIPIINNALTISCRLQNEGYIGTLQWDGKNAHYAQLSDIGRHVVINKGDTVITSGVSAIFPKGIMVGTVEADELSDSDSFHHITVSLSTDFRRLQNVSILRRNDLEEIKNLEEYVKQ